MTFHRCLLLSASAVTLLSCSYKDPARETGEQPGRLIARIHESGFPPSHDTYNGMGTGSDGHIYYVLCSELPDVGARMYVFDPATQKTELLSFKPSM
jgi:hypothetical protein